MKFKSTYKEMSMSASMLTMQRQSKNLFYGNQSRRIAIDSTPSNRSRLRRMGSTNNDANPFTPVGKSILVKEFCPLWAKFGQNNRRQSPNLGPTTATAIRWSYAIGSSISSAAIDLNGIVYIGSDTGVFAFDSWGKFIWSYSTGSPIRSSPVIDSAGNVLIHSAGTVYSLRNGSLIWKYATASSDTGSEIQSSLTLTREGYAIFGSLDSYIYCLKDGVLQWSVKTASGIRGSATVVDTTVYIGSTDSKLYAIDTLTGKILWTYITGGAIISTPAIGYGYIYFGSSDGYVYCLTNAGLLQWRYRTGAAVYASPAIGEAVYISSEDQYVYALDPILGNRKWRTLLDTSPTSPTLGNDGTLYVATLVNLYTLTKLGSILSKYISGSRASPTVSQDGTLYLPSGEFIYSIQTIVSKNTSSGWLTFGQNNQRQSKYNAAISGIIFTRKKFFLGPIFSSPCIIQNILYIGGGSKLYAIDTKTNLIVWSYTTNGIVNSSPTVLEDGTVFFGSTDGYIYSLSSSGTLIWRFKTESDGIRDAFIQGTNSTITLSNGYAIFGSFDYYIYCISSTEGTLVWKIKTGGWVQGSAAVSGTTVYIGSADYKLYAINIFTGSILWTYTTEFGIDSIPAIGYNGFIYFGSIDNTFYALNPRGLLEWKYTASSSIYSSAAINSVGTVYFLSSDGYLYSVKGDTGVLIWRVFLERGFTPSSPLIGSDRNIYVGSSSKLYVVNEISGLIVLTYSLDSFVESSPLIGNDGTIYIGTVGGYLYSLTNNVLPPIWPMMGVSSAHTTKEKGPSALYLTWKLQLNIPNFFLSSPSIDRNGIVYVGCGYGLAALDSVTGYILWLYSTGPVYSSPTIDANGNVYFNSQDGYTYAVSSNSLLWKYYTGANSVSRSSVTIYDKYLIFGSIDTYIYCLYLDGTFVWRFKTTGIVQGSATIDKGTVYIASESILYSIDLIKGKLNYIYKSRGSIYSTPAVETCGNIYITSLDSRVHALNKGCNRIWDYTTGGPIYSSVAIGANRILYVTSTDGYLYAIQGEDGSLVWKVFLGLGLKCTPMIDALGNIYVASSTIYIVNSSGNIISQYNIQGIVDSCICIYNEKLYISSADGYLYAINGISNNTPSLYLQFGGNKQRNSVLNGPLRSSIQWKIPLNSTIFSSPSIDIYGNIYIGTDSGIVYSINYTTGATNLTLTIGLPIRSTIIIGGSTMYFLCDDAYLYAVTTTGTILWRFNTILPGDTVYIRGTSGSVTLSNDGYLIFGSANTYYIYCVKNNTLIWRIKTDRSVQGSAVILGSTAYIGSQDSKLYAIDIVSGTILWIYTTEFPICSSPAIYNNKIYFTSLDGSLYAINIDGTFLWSYYTGFSIYASPTIDGLGNVYISSDNGYVYSLSNNGELNWKYFIGQILNVSSPLVDNSKIVYVASSAGVVYAISDGSLVWSYQTGAQIRSSPTIGVNGALYIASDDGFLYSFY